jgi:hypothetical protein
MDSISLLSDKLEYQTSWNIIQTWTTRGKWQFPHRAKHQLHWIHSRSMYVFRMTDPSWYDIKIYQIWKYQDHEMIISALKSIWIYQNRQKSFKIRSGNCQCFQCHLSSDQVIFRVIYHLGTEKNFWGYFSLLSVINRYVAQCSMGNVSLAGFG